MKVVARRRVDGAHRSGGFVHEVDVEGRHTILIDEPVDLGGSDAGPSPGRLLASSLAGCTAVTMEMYAERKGWDIGAIEVEVDATYEDHMPTAFDLVVRLPEGLSEEQRERLLVVAAKCPVHRVLTGEVSLTIADRVETL